MKNVRDFFYPETLKEALKLLSENEGNSQLNVPVAGSTGIVFSKNPKITGLVDINRLGLDYIKKENGSIKIGASATVQKISRSKALQSVAGGILSKAAGSIGSRLIRNSCTIGGNISGLRIWSDLPAPLLVLDAKIKAQSEKGERIIPAEEFFSKTPSKILNPSELVTEIIIPVPEKSAGSFIKFVRTKVDYTFMDTAFYMELKDGKIINPGLSVSAVTLLPVRLKAIEEFLNGKALDEKLLEEVSKKAEEEINPIKTYKTTVEYRKHLAGVLIKRVVEEAYRGAVAE